MIRLALIDDLKEILEIVKKVINVEDKKLVNLWDETYPTKQVFLEDIKKQQLYVFDDGQVKGFVVISLEKENLGDIVFEIDSYIVVHRLCVNPDFQGNNIAYKLMEYAKEYAKNNNIKSIRLDTYSENPITNKFYKKLGYELKGIWNREKGIYNVYSLTIN